MQFYGDAVASKALTAITRNQIKTENILNKRKFEIGIAT